MNEKEQGNTDLNGDEDSRDEVLHLYDLATGSVSNLAVATGPHRLQAGRWYGFEPPVTHAASTISFLAVEENQGADLNGDGDQYDVVAATYHTGTGRIFCSRATRDLPVSARGVSYLIAYEPGNYYVVFAADPRTGRELDTGVAIGDFVGGKEDGMYAFGDHAVITTVSEQRQGADLNGDGDMADRVPVVVEARF